MTCDYCLKAIDGGTVHHLVVAGVPLDICDTDVRYLAHRPLRVRIRALRYLVRTYGAAQVAGDGDGDGDGPHPPAPAARPVALALVAAGCGPAWMELSPEDEAALDAFEQAIAEPLPCDACGRAASPGVETDEGLTLCLGCAEASASGRAAVAAWRFAATCRRLAAARAARELVGVS